MINWEKKVSLALCALQLFYMGQSRISKKSFFFQKEIKTTTKKELNEKADVIIDRLNCITCFLKCRKRCASNVHVSIDVYICIITLNFQPWCWMLNIFNTNKSSQCSEKINISTSHAHITTKMCWLDWSLTSKNYT